MWHAVGYETLLADQPWPAVQSELVVEDQVTIVVQVNGKLRAKLSVDRDMEQQNLTDLAMAEPTVQAAIGDKAIRKTVVVPNRIVNVVV
jgi:leucyl-tRNA synthetase